MKENQMVTEKPVKAMKIIKVKGGNKGKKAKFAPTASSRAVEERLPIWGAAGQAQIQIRDQFQLTTHDNSQHTKPFWTAWPKEKGRPFLIVDPDLPPVWTSRVISEWFLHGPEFHRADTFIVFGEIPAMLMFLFCKCNQCSQGGKTI